jgi:hypothetical protein
MLTAIGTEIVGGVVIGFVADNWLNRILFIWIVGLVACVELVFLRNNPLMLFFRKAMAGAGVSKDEVLGITGWSVYPRQFIFSTIAALPFSLLAGLVRGFFIS